MAPDILEQLENSSRKAFFVYDLPKQRFEVLSRAVEDIWEVKKEQILESPELLKKHLHPDDEEAILSRFEKVKAGESVEIEFCLKFKDDTIKQVKADAYPIKNEAGEVVAIAGLAENISERAQYRDYLIEFAYRKNSVLEIVAHDLRNPLAHINSVARLLELEHTSKNYEQLTTYTGIIREAYEDCIKLITDVLSDEHLKSPTIHVNKERVNVVSLIERVVETYRKSEMIEITYEIVADKDKIYAELDEVKVTQIINNLLSNSMKFTENGGKVSISVSQQERNLLITHSDTGIGIPDSLKPYLFTKYSKAARSGLRGEKSMGIGMSIVRDLVEIQGGSISFESEENKGTTFYITLPLR